MSAYPLPQETEMKRAPIPVARFRAPDGAHHTVAVLSVKDGWQIVDQNGRGREVVETLTDPRDERSRPRPSLATTPDGRSCRHGRGRDPGVHGSTAAH